MISLDKPGHGAILSIPATPANSLITNFVGDLVRITFGETLDGEQMAPRIAVIMTMDMLDGMIQTLTAGKENYIKTAVANAIKNKAGQPDAETQQAAAGDDTGSL